MGSVIRDGESKFGFDSTSIDFIAGTIGGIAGLIVGHPFDTGSCLTLLLTRLEIHHSIIIVKVRFQTPDLREKYRSTFHALATIIRDEKFTGLYKGITSPLASCALLNGVIFTSYRFFTRVQLDDPNGTPALMQVIMAGVATGIVSSLITTPVELVKIQQQNSLLDRPSTRAIALRLYKQHGVRGLYRGFTATVLRDLGYGAYFGSYEATSRLLTPSSSSLLDSTMFSTVQPERLNPSWPALLVAGGVAGIAGWLVTFPMDVVKTRIQGSDPTLPAIIQPVIAADRVPLINSITNRPLPPAMYQDNPYRSMLSTIVTSYRAEGKSVFYRGLAPTLIRAIPVNMATFAVFEISIRVLS